MLVHVKIAIKHCESNNINMSEFVVDHSSLSEVDTHIDDMIMAKDSCWDDEHDVDVDVSEYHPPRTHSMSEFVSALESELE